MRQADGALVSGNTANVVRVLFDQIAIQVEQFLSQFGGVLLIDAEHQGFGVAVSAFQQVGEMTRHCPRARTQRDDALEILGQVFLVGHFTAIAVQFILAGPPAGGIHRGDDAVNPVRRQESVLDALAQAVGIDRIAEVLVAVAGFLPQRGGGHAELHGRLEVVEHGAPTALVTTGAAMAFVDDDQIEEVRAVLAEYVFAGRAQGLVDAKVHVPALADVAAGNLVAGITERREHLGHRVINQNIAVGQEQDLRTAIFAGSVPAAVP